MSSEKDGGTTTTTHVTQPMPRTEIERTEGSALEELHRRERALILGARDDPDNTQMPGSKKTVTEYRREIFEQVNVEREETRDAVTESSRAQHVEGEELYADTTKVVASETGLFALVPANPGNEPLEGVEAKEGGKKGQGRASGGGTQITPQRSGGIGQLQPPDGKQFDTID